MNSKQQPDQSDHASSGDFRMRDVFLFSDLKRKIIAWLGDQVELFEAFFVAVTFHVLLFPVLWFAGWALPWPKGPDITTVIEINLEHWPAEARPERIEEIYNMKRTQLRHSK